MIKERNAISCYQLLFRHLTRKMLLIHFTTTSKTLTNLKNTVSNYEIIFVDDGSTDNTWLHMQDITAQSTLVHAIKFSRNFGKEAAIFAGLHKAKGDCAIIMDCDLQHPLNISKKCTSIIWMGIT